MQSSIIKGDIGTLYPFPRVLYDSLQDHGFPVNQIPGRFYDSLQDHGFPVNPIPGRLYDSLQDHGFPENPVPGILYIPHPWWPPLGP